MQKKASSLTRGCVKTDLRGKDASVAYDTTTSPWLTVRLLAAPAELAGRIVPMLAEIFDLVAAFMAAGPTAALACEFEKQLQRLLCELGRRIVEWTFNGLEPAASQAMPGSIQFAGESYRRGARQPRRGLVATLFGPIRLVRWLYRARTVGEPALFPLEINLGIEAGGATPALAERVGWLSAVGTQSATLAILAAEHGVKWSVATLRKLLAGVAEALAVWRHPAQVARLLEWLQQADRSHGSRKIVLAVGRDGVMVPIRKSKAYQEAATATVSVFDRLGKRLGTVYLGRMPEPGQPTLSAQLTSLLTDVLQQWTGPLPRLCYVTDAGHHPTDYFQRVLKPMVHPRTGKRLAWEWVVDYYHACVRVTQMAQALFGVGKEASAWARRMRRWLRDKPRGAFRVLHSAAALANLRGLRRGLAKQYRSAYRYLRERLAFLDYADYRRRGLPIGSGITEAACKIVFSYRFKQSGMTWSLAGGQTILDLRLLRLSQVWNPAWKAHLEAKPVVRLHYPTQNAILPFPLKIAA